MSVIDDAFSKLDGKSLDNIHQHGLDQLIHAIDELLGLQLASSTPDIDDDTKQLIIERERARDNKDWAKSDKLRDELASKNIVVRDTKSGSIWEYNN
jgi:cysteinyl-tRNA synthetase